MCDEGVRKSAKREGEEREIGSLLLGIMEGYNDTVIPPLSYFSPNLNVEEDSAGSRKRQVDEALVVERLFKGRKRREEMNQRFSVLQSLVPSLFDEFKPSQERIIGDTVSYIKCLEAEIKRLENLKKLQPQGPKEVNPLLSMQCTDGNSALKVKVSRGTTFFAIQLPYRLGLVPEIVMVFEKHKAEVLEARVHVNDQKLLTFTATIILGKNGGSSVGMIKEEILTL